MFSITRSLHIKTTEKSFARKAYKVLSKEGITLTPRVINTIIIISPRHKTSSSPSTRIITVELKGRKICSHQNAFFLCSRKLSVNQSPISNSLLKISLQACCKKMVSREELITQIGEKMKSSEVGEVIDLSILCLRQRISIT
jgi:hypothetical protein